MGGSCGKCHPASDPESERSALSRRGVQLNFNIRTNDPGANYQWLQSNGWKYGWKQVGRRSNGQPLVFNWVYWPFMCNDGTDLLMCGEGGQNCHLGYQGECVEQDFPDHKRDCDCDCVVCPQIGEATGY